MELPEQFSGLLTARTSFALARTVAVSVHKDRDGVELEEKAAAQDHPLVRQKSHSGSGVAFLF